LTRVDAGTLVRMGGKGQWQPARAGLLLGTGDEIRTARGVAELTYGDGTVTRLGPNSTLGLKDQQTRGMRLWFGRLWMKVAKGSGGMKVQTPAAVAAVTGTDLFVFHEPKAGGQHAAKPVIAMAGSFRLAADDKVSTIGLLEGGVRVQKLQSNFETGMLQRPGKGVWIAGLDLKGFKTAQEAGGFDLDPGQKCETDGNTVQISQMSPDEIANNRSVMNDVGASQSNSGGGNQNGNQGNKNNQGNRNNNQGNRNNNQGNRNNQGSQGNRGGQGQGGQGGQGNQGGNGGNAVNQGGNTNNGGNNNTGTNANGTTNNGGENNGDPGTGPNAGPGAGPEGPTGPTGMNPTGPANPQPGSTDGDTPAGPNPNPTGPDGGDAGPPPAPAQPVLDPTQNTQDQLIRPVDRSPASGELEIIIQ
jgi:hypothetical protein